MNHLYYIISITFINLVCYCYSSFDHNVYETGIEKYFTNIKSSASAEIQRKATIDVIARTLPNEHSKNFFVIVNLTLPNSYFKILKHNDASDNKVFITASNGVSACRAFYYYLKYFLNSQISWDGNNLQSIPDNYPTVNFEFTSPNRFIYYQNVCTYSYSFAWWTWENWRVHLDWMAMNGINIFIAPVQEKIWTNIYKKLNLTENEINDHLAGPGFLAWQRMGNIRGWGGPLTDNFKDFSLNLQQKIIKAARELGMVVAIPGFAGHVPHAMRRVFPNSTFSPAERWNRFSDEFCCPLFLDPTDSLFQCIGQMFITECIKEYGTDHIYFSDPFNEMQPTLATVEYLRNASLAIYETMKTVDSEAIWLLQGWMFVKNPFWNEDLIKAFLTANPIGTMLILDLQSEQHPQYIRTNFFYGQPFIWCMLHNFGGTLGMHGSINTLNSSPIDAKLATNSTMIGFGITPEGINQNYMLYEFALEMGWMMEKQNLTSWVESYVLARYGQPNTKLSDAWKYLLDGAYNYNLLDNMRGKYVFNRRPSLKITPWTWYDIRKVKYVWKLFLDESNKFNSSLLFQHDLIDITRQNLQILTDRYYLLIKIVYKKKKLNKLKKISHDFVQLLVDIENILGTSENFHLGKWLNQSKNFAITIKDENLMDLYEKNARYQITLWGPNGEIIDYANKQWAGVTKKFFLPRWKIFLKELQKSIILNKKIDEKLLKKNIMEHAELPFVNSRNYSDICKGDSIMISKRLYRKWNNKIKHLNLPQIPLKKLELK